MFDGRWRGGVDRTTRPVGQALQRVGISADVLTATGLVSATATAVAAATGHFHLAIFFLILTGMHDLLDGPVAKASGTASIRGAFFDSVTDRVCDALLLGGVAWYLVSQHRGHLVLLPFGVFAVAALISYERAKAEALGIDGAKGGLMERAERMILLGVGFLATMLLVPVLWVMLVLTSLTAIGRFVRVWRAAEAPARAPLRVRMGATPLRGRRRETRVDSRWRAWREGVASGRSVSMTGQPLGRWRARRQETLASRTGRTLRERRVRANGRVGPSRRSSGTRPD